jgi:ferric-dicitrate binding protein FerR (iron transport regulator)
VITADEPDYDNQIAQLLKLAGRRPSPGADRIRQAREAAHGEWTRTRRARGRRRLAIALAAAAAVAAGAIGGGLWLRTDRAPTSVARPELATLRKTVGHVRIIDPADRAMDADLHAGGRRLAAGDRVDVGQRSLAAFELADGTSVRLAGATLVRLDADNRLTLERGTIYVDANPALATRPTRVETPFGTIRHVGTQFQVRVLPESLSVRVREGEVVVERPDAMLTSFAGEGLLVARDGQVQRTTVPKSGAEWAWVATIAAPFTLEGASVPACLDWASREQGWRWEYADAAAKRKAERAVLHGSIDGMAPADVLLAALPAAGLTSEHDGDRLIVSVLP